jgi:hypothetical protein
MSVQTTLAHDYDNGHIITWDVLGPATPGNDYIIDVDNMGSVYGLTLTVSPEPGIQFISGGTGPWMHIHNIRDSNGRHITESVPGFGEYTNRDIFLHGVHQDVTWNVASLNKADLLIDKPSYIEVDLLLTPTAPSGSQDWIEQSSLIIPLSYSFDQAVPEGDLIEPAWENDHPLTADRSNVLQFRQDMRNAVLDAIDSDVRKYFLAYWSDMLAFEGHTIEDWSPVAFESSERVRLVNSMVTEMMYNVEKIWNVFDDEYVQTLYTDIYAQIEGLRNNLSDHINSTLSASVHNLERSADLLETLQTKVDTETIINYKININTIPEDKINAYLYTTNSTETWDVAHLITQIAGQTVIDFESLAQVIGNETPDYFRPWYIKVFPTARSFDNYYADENNRLVIDFFESDTNILGATVIDAGGKSYKIVNKMSGDPPTWVLNESLARTTVGEPITIIYNYFETQILELQFAWMHNYVPDLLSFDINIPETEGLKAIPEAAEVIGTDESEVREEGIPSTLNKEIF